MNIKFKYWFEMPHKYTFKQPKLRKFVLKYIPPNSLVLNAFAGKYRFPKNRFDNTKFVYNDINDDIDADYHLEAWNLDSIFPEENFDCIIADPPFSLFQFYAKYTKAKKEGTEENFRADYNKWRDTAYFLLKPLGVYIELGYNTVGLGKDRSQKIAIGICCQGSSRNDILITVQKKIKNKSLERFIKKKE